MNQPAVRIKQVVINIHNHAPIGDLIAGELLSSQAMNSGVRFVLANDGTTVIDHKTGLMWPVDESPKQMEFAGAEAFAKSFSAGGFNDWRLPDLEELESIRDLTRHAPCIDTSFFKSNGSWTWSRTPCAWSSDLAWVVGFDYGYVGGSRRNGEAWVRPVRVFSAGQ